MFFSFLFFLSFAWLFLVSFLISQSFFFFFRRNGEWFFSLLMLSFLAIVLLFWLVLGSVFQKFNKFSLSEFWVASVSVNFAPASNSTTVIFSMLLVMVVGRSEIQVSSKLPQYQIRQIIVSKMSQNQNVNCLQIVSK